LLLIASILRQLISYAGTTDPCIEEAPESIEIITSVFRYYSLAVSCFFALEMLTKVAVFGWRYFCDPWQMLDAVVVAAGLVTNIVLIGGSSGLVFIVARAVRLVRFGHGVAESTEEQHHKQVQRLQQQLDEQTALISQLNNNLHEQLSPPVH
jgi:uncharacterized membrane protein YcjF (UPF0283 family)